ncbi:MAG: hypothetical protein JXR44_07195 [Thiotrichales bacterium]|nr:hypothetical protein [Thiotrichales bacterium]
MTTPKTTGAKLADSLRRAKDSNLDTPTEIAAVADVQPAADVLEQPVIEVKKEEKAAAVEEKPKRFASRRVWPD